MGGSSGSSDQRSTPGTLSPITATLLSLFGGQPIAYGGQFQPMTWNQGGAFTPEMFGALPGLLQNQPLTGVEQMILGATPAQPVQVPQFDQAGYEAALRASGGTSMGGGTSGSGRGKQGGGGGSSVSGGPAPNPADFVRQTTIPGMGSAFGGGLQGAGLLAALQSQGLFEQGAGALSKQLQGPEAAIALARRGFEQETLPSILERAPGFSSSDLQRELTRAGTDLETQIGALREAGISQAIQMVPGFAQEFGTNLLDQASQVLGFGQLGREMVREAGPAGDAFRVLTALQSLTGPGLTNVQVGSSKSKEGHVL